MLRLREKTSKCLCLSSWILFVITVIAIPLVFDTRLTTWHVLPKEYIFVASSIVLLMGGLLLAILGKRLILWRTALDVFLGVVLVVTAISTIFSVAFWDSLSGRTDYFSAQLLFLFFLIVSFYQTIAYTANVNQKKIIIDILIGVGGITAIIYLIKLVGNFDILARLHVPIWSTIDPANSNFGIWLVAICLIASGRVASRQTSVIRLAFSAAMALLTCLASIGLGFELLWWFLGAGFFLLVGVGIYRATKVRVGWLYVLCCAFLFIVGIIIFGLPWPLRAAAPAEAVLGVRPSLSIMRQTLHASVKNLLFGSGPGTFIQDFSKFRDTHFNSDPIVAALRFNHPVSSLVALVTEGGILTLLAFMALVIAGLVKAIRHWQRDAASSDSANQDMEHGAVIITWLILTAGAAVFFYGPTVWWLWWLLLALTVSGTLAGTKRPSAARVELLVQNRPRQILIFTFFALLHIAALIFIMVGLARWYGAEFFYARAMRRPTASVALVDLNYALRWRRHLDSYHVAAAQGYLAQVSAAPRTEPGQIAFWLSQAVNEARRAVELSPQAVANWDTVALLYENSLPFTREAFNWAESSLRQAQILEPTNPAFPWRRGVVYTSSGRWVEAEQAYREALSLQPKNIPAALSLAIALEQLGRINEAIGVYRSIISFAPSVLDARFHYGRILYNRNLKDDRIEARRVWQEAIKQAPNYANALYGLGVLFEAEGDLMSAKEYYLQVQALNPTNEDISNKIAALSATSTKK